MAYAYKRFNDEYGILATVEQITEGRFVGKYGVKLWDTDAHLQVGCTAITARYDQACQWAREWAESKTKAGDSVAI